MSGPERSVPLRPAAALWALVLGGALGGCPPPPAGVLVARPGLGSAPAPAASAPVFWYHPRVPADVLTEVALGDDDVLTAGEQGERWRWRGGKGSASPWLLPEPVVGVVARGAAGWTFVAASGATFDAAEPLGAWSRATPPPQTLVELAVGDSLLLGLGRDGTLLASHDAGARWARVDAAPVGRWLAVAVEHAGADGAEAPERPARPARALALAAPEELFLSVDGGRAFARLAVPPVGARALRGGAELRVEGAQASFVIDDQGGLAPAGDGGARARARPRGVGAGAAREPPRGPDAASLLEGLATLDGDRWTEIGPGLHGAGDYRLWEGRLGEPLTEHAVPALAPCRAVRLARSGAHLGALCWRSAPESIPTAASLHLSRDGGRTFAEGGRVWGRPLEVRLALTDDGALILGGVCSERMAGPGCAAAGVHWLPAGTGREGAPAPLTAAEKPPGAGAWGEAGHAAPLAPLRCPGLSGAPQALTVTPDGALLVAGEHAKGGALWLWRGDPRAELRGRPLTDPAGTAPDPPGDRPEAFEGRHGAPPPEPRRPATASRLFPTVVTSAVARLAADDDGAVTVQLGEGERALVVDATGAAVTAVTPPAGATRLAGIGARLLALAPEAGLAWESADGGVSWSRPFSAPLGACRGEGRCQVAVVCAQAGCVLGELATRVGWGAPHDEPPPIPGAPTPTPEEGLLRPPLACTVSGEWTLVAQGTVPGAAQAGFGAAAWWVVEEDPKTGRVEVVVARRDGTRARLTLLGAATGAHRLFREGGGAGVARLRLPMPASSPSATSHGGLGADAARPAELAWFDPERGTVHRVTFPVAEPRRAGPAGFGGLLGAAGAAAPSEAFGGMASTPAAWDVQLWPEGPTVIDTRSRPRRGWVVVGGRVRAVSVEAPAGPGWGRTVLVPHGGGAAAFVLGGEGQPLLRLGAPPAALTTSGAGALDRGGALELTTALDGAPAVHVARWARQGRGRGSFVFPLAPEGASPARSAVPAPLQLDLADDAAPCAPGAGGARVVVPFQVGTRWPVQVELPGQGPVWLVTGTAALGGAVAAPCVHALEAEEVVLAGSRPRRGAAPPALRALLEGARGRGTLFRADTTGKGLEARPLACEPAPALEVPPALRTLPGTTRVPGE